MAIAAALGLGAQAGFCGCVTHTKHGVSSRPLKFLSRFSSLQNVFLQRYVKRLIFAESSARWHWGQGTTAAPGPAQGRFILGEISVFYPTVTLINHWYFLSHTSTSFRFRLQGQDRRLGLSTAPMSPSLGSPSAPVDASDLAPTGVR